MKLVAFCGNAHDLAGSNVLGFGHFDRVHRVFVVIVSDFRANLGDAFVCERIDDLVVDIGESDLIIHGFLRRGRHLESHVEAIEGGE